MGSKHCRLYDENLVHSIMNSTGLAVFEFLKENTSADDDDLCEFLELHTDSIIDDTIEQLNGAEEDPQRDERDGNWPFDGDGTMG